MSGIASAGRDVSRNDPISCHQNFGQRRRKARAGVREDLGPVLPRTLTLLVLSIGFTFSIAVSRHDPRKNLEQEQANPIGTEYARADLLPATDALIDRALT
jgi:hypothetical protein